MSILIVAAMAPGAVAREHLVEAWRNFDRRAAKTCPALKLGSKPAGDIAYLQERFSSALGSAELRSFNKAIPRIEQGPAP